MNSLPNDFVWDDKGQVFTSPNTREVWNIPSFFGGGSSVDADTQQLTGTYYKPLMPTVFVLIYGLFGPQAWSFHLFQISLHIANAILIFGLFSRFWNRWLAFFLAAVFLVHPIQTEAVIYISALQEPLFMFFGLLSMWLISREKEFKAREYGLVGGLFLLSLLAKETGVLFLIIGVVYAYFFHRNRLGKVGLMAFASFTLYLFLRLIVAKVPFQTEIIAPISHLSLAERLINLPQILWFYATTFWFPRDLAISQYWLVTELNWPDFYQPLTLMTVIVISALYLAKRLRSKLWWFFGIWLSVGLAFHSQLFPLDLTVAERWFYFPIVGLLGLIGVVFDRLGSAGRFGKYWWIGAVIIALLLTQSVVRNFDWKDSFRLLAHDSMTNKNSFSLANNLGMEYFRKGEMGLAQEQFKKSIALNPNYWVSYNNAGVTYVHQGDLAEAEKNYQKATQVKDDYSQPYENLVRLELVQRKNFLKASALAQVALKKFPANHRIWVLLSFAQYKLGESSAAITSAKQAVALSPTYQNRALLQDLQNNVPLKLSF